MTALIEALFNGLSISSILILTALGLAITFGVMRVINMAHGEMLMLGAYAGYVLTHKNGLPTLVQGLGRFIGTIGKTIGQRWDVPWTTTRSPELPLFLAIPIVFLVVGLFGYALERCLIRFLYGRPLDTLLATWGVGLMVQQIVRLIMGADVKEVVKPTWLDGQWHLENASFPKYRLFIIVFTAVCLLFVYLWFYYTPQGLKIRAVTQNRSMASAAGISTGQVDSMTFAFGTGLAGVAGCIVGCIYNVVPDMGNEYIVEAFMVVILGGMGQLSGVIYGGLVIGVARGIAEKIYGNAIFPELFPKYIEEVFQPTAKVTVLALVILFIMFRPQGLVRTKERVYE